MKRRAQLALCLLAGAAAAPAALAQSGAEPARLPSREEIERPPVQDPASRAPRLIVEGGIERAPCALDARAYRDIRFTLAGVAFEELKGLPAEALRPAWEPYVGFGHPIAILCDIRDRAATILRDAGYIAAVEIPEQRIGDGNIRFQVLTAKLVAVRVRGDAGRAERTLARYLEALTGREAFNRYEAERYLLLARDMPGYDVRLALRSAEARRGEVIGEVTVERIPGEIDFNVQNYGGPELGRWGAMLRGQVYGLTGLGDRTSLALFTTADPDEQQTVQLGQDFRVGGEGLTLGARLVYARARPISATPPSVSTRAPGLPRPRRASHPYYWSGLLVRLRDRRRRRPAGPLGKPNPLKSPRFVFRGGNKDALRRLKVLRPEGREGIGG